MTNLDEVLAYCAEATEGPWIEWAGLDPDGGREDGISPASDVETDICKTPVTPQGVEDATFIAQARTDLPRLAAFARDVLALADDCLETQVPYYEEQAQEWGPEQGKDDEAKAEIYRYAGESLQELARKHEITDK